MDILSKVIECEIEYLKRFCKSNHQQTIIRFLDDLMPDYWPHNYTWIKSADNNTELLQIIESELSHSRNIRKNI